MPAAPDLFTLYALEEALEPAVVAALVAQGVPACRQRDLTIIDTPRVEVSYWAGAPTTKQHIPTGAQYTPSQTFPCAFHGRLVLSTVTNRKGGATNGGRHAELVGKSRLTLLLALSLINSRLPYHRLNLVKEEGLDPRVDRDANLDVSPMVANVQIEIKSDAWPVAVPEKTEVV